MSKQFSLNSLAQDIRTRNMGAENARLVKKWEQTGLLEGLKDAHRKEVMSRLLENQCAELLRENGGMLFEASSVSTGGGNTATSGDIRGFQNIAFPIVRRVFGGLLANELISIQPMALPSGLLFYLDYTYGTNTGAAAGQATYEAGESVYNNPAGKGVRSGSLATGGQYDLVGTGYTKVHKSTSGKLEVVASGAFNSAGVAQGTLTRGALMVATGSDATVAQFDPELLRQIEFGGARGDRTISDPGTYSFVVLKVSQLSNSTAVWDSTQAEQVALSSADLAACGLGTVGESIQGGKVANVRRLNQVGTYSVSAGGSGGTWTHEPFNGAHMLMVVTGTLKILVPGQADANTSLHTNGLTASFVVKDTLDVGGTDGDTLTIPSFETDFASSPTPAIPEIDIKVEALSVTSQTRKLRARWTPELAQDLNAYHNLDAEVELTQILSEQIALEIDREILNDLLVEAKGANFFWSRSPGRFVDKRNGSEISRTTSLTPGPAFTGTVREWYETLVETVIDVANEIYRKTLRGSANFVVTSPQVCTILEASALHRPDYKVDASGQVTWAGLGVESVGSLAGRFKLYKDPYFPANKILVGYKGGSFLETGYVYAPYVPLIVTPTIFEPDDFTPRKGVMTRYGKKMVRSDFFGSVTIIDMQII